MLNYRTLLATISILISLTGYSQGQITIPIQKDVYNNFDWHSIEKKVSKIEVDQFIKSTPDEFEYFKQSGSDVFENLDSLRHHIHLDLNNDNLLDVIFQGHNGAEAEELIIFINTGKGYINIFNTMQAITKIDWQDHRLSRIFVYDWGCCADYLKYHKIYDVYYDTSGMPAIKQIYQSVLVNRTVIPDRVLIKPLRFEILNNNYKIRFAPKIDETSLQPWSDEKPAGNTIGKLVKGTQGIALGRKVDKTGREWLYVEIDEKYYPTNDVLYTDGKFPTKVVGWISSLFIKIL